MKQTVTLETIDKVVESIKWIPLNTDMIVSMNETEKEGDELNLSNSSIKQNQFVLAVGSMVREIKVGDEVLLDMDKLTYTTRNSRDFDSPVIQLNMFPLETEDGLEVACISSQAVKFIKKK